MASILKQLGIYIAGSECVKTIGIWRWLRLSMPCPRSKHTDSTLPPHNWLWHTNLPQPVQTCTTNSAVYPYKIQTAQYWLPAGWSADRIPVAVRYFAPVQTGPGAHPIYLYNGDRVFPGGRKRPGHNADPSPPSSAKVWKQSSDIPLLSLRAFVACKKGETYPHTAVNTSLLPSFCIHAVQQDKTQMII
jgi:hypothetical protein